MRRPQARFSKSEITQGWRPCLQQVSGPRSRQNALTKEIIFCYAKWQHRFTFTLRCQKRAGELNKQELEMLNRLWKVYDTTTDT